MSIRNLKLEVVLAAVDKATRPIKNVLNGSSALSKQLKETKDKLKQLNDAQSNVTAFRELSKKAKESSNALTEARTKLRDMQQQMATTGQSSEGAVRKLTSMQIAVDRLTESHRKQLDGARQAREKLEANGISIKKLGSYERELATQVDSTTLAMARQQERLAKLSAHQNRMRGARSQYEQRLENRDRVAGAGATTTAAGTAIGLPVVKMVRDYSSFEDAMLGIARQVPGARDDAGKLTAVYHDMAREVKLLSREIPIPTNQIAEMVTAGARMEVPRNELIEFTRTISMMATAFDAVPDEIAESMGKVAKNFKIPVTQIRGLADTINYLDDNAISKGGDIIDVLNRISGVVSTVKMTDKAAAALASTLLTLGERPETASTAINAMVQKFAAAEKGTKKFHAAMKEIGLSSKNVQKGMASDAMGTLFGIIDHIQKLPSDKRIGVMVELVGMEHSDTLAKLVDKPEELKRQLALANGNEAKGSMGKEFAARQDTLSAKWQTSQNRLFNSSSDFGKTLRPALIETMDVIGNVLDKVSAWTAANPVLAATLVKIAAVLSVVLVAVGTLLLAVAGIAGPFIAARYAVSMLGIKLGSVMPETWRFRTAISGVAPALTRVNGVAGTAAATIRSKLATAWQEANPKKAGADLYAYAKTLKDRVPAATSAAWQTTRQWGIGLHEGLKKNVETARATTKRYTAQLWQTVKAQHAANRAAVAGKWQGIKSYVTTKGVGGMGKDAVKGGWNMVKGGVISAVNGMGSALMGLGRVILFVGRLAMMNPIGLAIAAAAFLVMKYWEPIKSWFGGFWHGLTAGLAPLSGMFDKVFAAIGPALEPLRPVWDWLVGAFRSAWDWISRLLSPLNATKESLDAAGKSGEGFGRWLANLIVIGAELVAKFATIGVQMMQGLVSGITRGLVWVKEAISGVGDMLPEWLRKKLDIHSPSRVFATIGGFAMAGLTGGLEGSSSALAAVQDIADQLITKAKSIVLPAPALGIRDEDSSIVRRRALTEAPPLMQRIRAMLPELPRADLGGIGNGFDLLRDVIGKITTVGSGMALGLASGTVAANVPIDHRPPVSMASAAPVTSQAPQITITINPAAGMNEQQLAQLVAREVEKIQRETAARGRSRFADKD